MSLSDSYENSMLDHITGRTTLTFVAQVYISLHTGNPGETGAAEFTDSGYARKAINFNAATTSGATNSGQVDFNSIVDGAVTATHFGLWTAATGGVFIFGGAFSSSKGFVIAATPKILNGELTITLAGNWSNYLYTRILDHILGTTSYTKPASSQIHLYTTNPTAADSGTEVGGGLGYAAQTTEWDAAAGGATQNTNEENFGPATGNWGSVAHWGLRDNGGTNLLLFGLWAAALEPETGDDYVLNTGDLDLTLT